MDLESPLLAPSPELLASVKVFPLIPALKHDVNVYSALNWDQLTASDINFAIVKPIVVKYARLRNMSVVYACLVVRSYYLGQLDLDLANAAVMQTRAMLCEILAMKLLTHFASNDIHLVAVLTTCWNPLAGAPFNVIDEVKTAIGGSDDDLNSPQSALEMAISTKAKSFLSSPLCQRVVNQIYSGSVVFSLAATRSVLADNYKPRSITLYNPRHAPFLDHYRLRVPKYGAILEFLNFALLLITFVLCLFNRDVNRLNTWEVVFIIFAAAFTLDEYTASNEHGWIIYIANMWNVFDFAFIIIFLGYLVLRMQGISNGNVALSNMAFDILACGACILFPRLAFFVVSNNVVILSLRAMIAQFVFFIGIAAICFSGLLFTLWTLAKDDETAHERWSLKSIAWLMVQIWFGNTYLSFAQASSFHPIFGPILMTGFAALSNTLLLTIMISTLSNTAALINANAAQEYLFQFAIKTIQGVKSDALFSYQPPFNVLALILLKPASWFLTPRALHSFNVFLIKLTNLPTLVIIGIYERYFAAGQILRETSKDAAHSLFNSLPRQIKNIPLFEALVGSSTNGLYDAIFDVDLNGESELFNDSDEEQAPGLLSRSSREDSRSRRSPTPKVRRQSPSPGRASASGIRQRMTSPRLRVSSALSPVEIPFSAEYPNSNAASPLTRLFTNRTPLETQVPEANLKKIENLLDEVRDLPVQRLKDEMKELQERQARIENLLLVLTRGMRNDTPMTPRWGTTS
ncbi:hypothetical protein AMATHDRAFT_138783 [Amanita thiersii Skay4041]|uniref:Polycystin cation channel PKD1/PKD2 domain-containing protein n=1 Tax=Amanita thiersii Skay4041 TaxID=703135 RepID=A0A2A9NYJ8_9AGAR|nr:hypothetical protein AMATHDRAFT_138783 [Amanita thiersii Skay4041]